MAKTKTPVVVATVMKPTLIEEVLDRFKDFQDTTGAILDDYLVADGAITELAAADESFIEDLKEMDEGEDDFETLLEKLKKMDVKDVDHLELFELCADHLDPENVSDVLTKDGFIYIKVENIVLRDKLEEFIKTEIMPSVNEQCANLFM
jgi:hypothetical protein